MATTIRASTPVSSLGSTTCTGAAARPVRPPSLYQCTRNRFRGSASSGPTPASAAVTAAGMVSGAASCAKVGSRMPARRNQSTARP